jgi:hypothetical protein
VLKKLVIGRRFNTIMDYEFYYPENLGKEATLLLWHIRDAAITIASVVASILILVWTSLYIPLVASATYAFLTIRLTNMDYTVYEYIKIMIRYVFDQQKYHWRID